jgi:predicted CoA-substrate-specific enzyme activase
MQIESVVDPALLGEIGAGSVIGVDIGSRAAKAVLLHQGRLYTALVPTGVDMQDSADELLAELLEQAGTGRDAIEQIVGTGYGRIALQFIGIPCQIVTEISCHAMGAHFLNAGTRTIIDIGGQDSKAIQVNPADGRVVKFIMNDKCAAGTGRFLEKAAGLLEYTLEEIGPASLGADGRPAISSQCVVFAESEIISFRARGERRENIAAGLHFASARRVKNLINKIPLAPDLVFTGGVSNNVGMQHALEEIIGHRITPLRLDPIFAGALGAAIYAQRFLAEVDGGTVPAGSRITADLAELVASIRLAEQALVERQDVKKVGYLCNYVPVEILAASGAAYTRLAKCGDPDTVSRGEVITKSVFCDFIKGTLGSFAAKDPLYDSLDEVVTFYTCDSMKSASEAINIYFKPSRGYVVPRNGQDEESRRFFRLEMLNFRRDLEKLAGNPIPDDAVSEQIRIHNRLRELVRKISGLRRRNNPPLSGRDFLDITRAFYALDPDRQIILLEDVYNRLVSVPDDEVKRLRLMMAGGIVADGDRRILDLVEDQIGARVVIEDHCAGYAPFSQNTDEQIDPFQALANAYLDRAPCARQFPIETRIDFSAGLAEEYRVDGVLYTYLKFCSCYGMTKNLFLARFQELGIPVLELASDYSVGDTGQIKTRLEAFVEVLQERRGGVQ